MIDVLLFCIGAIVVLLVLMIVSILLSPKPDFERMIEDEAQEKYLKEYAKRQQEKKRGCRH